MKARDLMSRDTECVAASDTLEQAARRLAQLGVGAMPICGDDDRLMGMLSDRDIVVKAVAEGKDLARTLVRELAEGKPVTIGADDSVGDTLKTMASARVRRLPVIDGRRLVGIISQADVARNVSNRQSGRLLAAVSSRGSAHRSRRLMLVPILLAVGAGLYWSWKRWQRSSASGNATLSSGAGDTPKGAWRPDAESGSRPTAVPPEPPTEL